MRAFHHPSKACFDASLMHLLNTGEKVPPPKGEVANARTVGGAYRQLFSRYRREMQLGILSENCLEFRSRP